MFRGRAREPVICSAAGAVRVKKDARSRVAESFCQEPDAKANRRSLSAEIAGPNMRWLILEFEQQYGLITLLGVRSFSPAVTDFEDVDFP